MESIPIAQQLLSIFSGRTDDYLRDGKRAFKPLNEACLVRHLEGVERIGIYPTSHTGWLCFDFDGKNIKEGGAAAAFDQALRVREAFGCGLLELSRSGLGYHLWVFFEFPWPSVEQVKRLGIAALRHCDLPTDEKENIGHPGVYPHPQGTKGVGKTPFLPLHGLTAGATTSIFIDSLGQPYKDQLEALGLRNRQSYSLLLGRFPLVTTSPKTGAPVETHSRHDTIRDVAMRLRNHLPLEGTRYLVRAVAKSLGLLDLGREAEVESAIESAYDKPPIQVKTQFDLAYEATPTTTIREATLKEMKDMKEMELDYIIEGLVLPQEAILIASPPGAGKSMISMSLALAAASGKAVFGQYDLLEPLRVVYVNEEMSDREFAKRMNKLANGMGVDLESLQDNLVVFPQQGLVLHPDNPTGLNAFKARMLEFRPHIVILDTFLAIFGSEEKDSGAVRHWYNAVVVWLRANVGAAVIVQHHIKKPPDDFSFRGIDDTALLYLIRGSSDLPGAFERVFVLWKFGDNATDFGRLVNISVRNPKARSGDKSDPFDLVIDDASFEATTVGATKGNKSPQAGQNDARVLHALAQHDDKMLKTELLKYLQDSKDATERTSYRWLKGAMKRQVCHQKGDWIIKNT